MGLLQIRTAGDPVLKQIAQPVEHITKKIKRLLDDMAETMYHADGVGLAAPQVGLNLRIFVVDDGNGLIECINPVIEQKTGVEVASEGCLSIPGLYGDVERAATVTLHATNRDGKLFRIENVTGLLARALQHEYDHLEGVLFIDLAKTLQRR